MRQWTIDIIPLEAQRRQSEVRPHRNVPISQSINQNTKMISDKNWTKPAWACGCSVHSVAPAEAGVTQSLHTAERHAERRDGEWRGLPTFD